MPAVGRLIGTPASISASEEPQTVAMDEEPFELGDLGDEADRVGEFGRSRQHRADGAPGELAVADLAPAGRAHATRLADRIGREVVMEQEALLIGALERVDVLLVLARAECGHDQRLRLAAREQRRAVRARQHAGLGDDRPHGLHVAPVDAQAVVENVPAHDLGLQIVEGFVDLLLGELRLRALRRERREDLVLDSVHRRVALLLDGDLIGLAQLLLADLGDRLGDRLFVRGHEVARLLGGALGEANDRVDHRLETAMSGHHRLEHRLLGELLGLRLDHEHRVRRAGDDEVERRILHLLDRRIELQRPIDETDARPADGTHEGDARKRQRGGGGDHREDVGIILEIVREHGQDDLRVVPVAVDEERPDRSVDQPRDQGLALRRTALALEISAGNAARGEGLLLIVDGEREEILAGLGRLGRDHGGENGGLAPGREHGAVGLAGDLARLEHELAPGPVDLFAMDFEHMRSFSHEASRGIVMSKTARSCGMSQKA